MLCKCEMSSTGSLSGWNTRVSIQLFSNLQCRQQKTRLFNCFILFPPPCWCPYQQTLPVEERQYARIIL